MQWHVAVAVAGKTASGYYSHGCADASAGWGAGYQGG